MGKKWIETYMMPTIEQGLHEVVSEEGVAPAGDGEHHQRPLTRTHMH